MIQQLKSDVISQLRSGVALTNFSQCVEELVLNSLDAGALCIIVDLDMCSRMVEVRDNGRGMSECDLRAIAKRYCTSKCQSLKDLENTVSYGYRGEAIASLAAVCERLEIVSRQKSLYRTYCKLVRNGKDMGVYERSTPLARPGTTVLAHGIFHTLPVRRKMVSPTMDLECIRRQMMAIAVIHPDISLTLRNKVNGCVYLHTVPSTSVLSTIAQLFGASMSREFQAIHHTCGAFRVSGYVNLAEQQNKSFQLVFINKRLVQKTKFHKIANQILSRRIQKMQEESQQKMLQFSAQYAGFLINLECPASSYDVTFEPAKTLVEFKNWFEPLTAVTESLNNLMQKEGFLPVEMQHEGTQLKMTINELHDGTTESDDHDLAPRKTICASNVRWSLHSSTAKRKVCSLDNKTEQKSTRISLGVIATVSKSDFCNDNGYPNESNLDENQSAILNCVSDDSKLDLKSSSDIKTASSSRGQKQIPRSKSIKERVSLLKKSSTMVDGYVSKKSRFGNSGGRDDDGILTNGTVSAGCIGGDFNCSGDGTNGCDGEDWSDAGISLCDGDDHSASSHGNGASDAGCDSFALDQSDSVDCQGSCGDPDSCGNHYSSGGSGGSCGNNFALNGDAQRLSGKRDGSGLNGGGDGHGNDVCDKPASNTDEALDDDTGGSEWLCHYDSVRGQQLYVNLRTGNTSHALLPREPEPNKQKPEKKSTNFMKTKTDLHPFARHLSRNFTPWLPKNDILAQKDCCRPTKNEPSNMNSMLKSWTNPVFETTGKTIMDTSLLVSKQNLPVGAPQSFQFTKDCFRQMEVIKQVDNKFIACCLTAAGSVAETDSLLVMVDQHAAHERVRLENFTKDIYTSNPCDVSTKPAASIKTSALSSPCKLLLPKHEVEAMKTYRAQLRHVGLTFEERELQQVSDNRQQEQHVIISSVPSIFLARDRDLGAASSSFSDSLESNVQNLIKEQLEVLHSTRGASTSLPQSVVRILNSQACHGAIRFGDALSLVECKQLMTSLASCDLPFQCAHGRPSMIPLLSLNSTKKEMTRKLNPKPPQLWKLVTRMKGMK